MREVFPGWRIAVLVCQNERDPGARRPCCGRERGASLARALRRKLRARGLRDEVLCTHSGCLDVCSGQGTTVAILGPQGREVWVVEGEEGAEEVVERVGRMGGG